jgi:hypothetical protein
MRRDSLIYALITILIIVIIVFAFLFSTNRLVPAYVEDSILGAEWGEDIAERQGSSSIMGLEKWASYTYRNNNDTYPAYVTVTSMKTLFMMNENELFSKTVETINSASGDGIVIDEASRETGSRALANGHKTYYVIYDGNDTSKNLNETIKIIGETWSCEVSGTSVICIGFAQITDNAHSNSSVNFTCWSKIISDGSGILGPNYQKDDGLIFNVKCH